MAAPPLARVRRRALALVLLAAALAFPAASVGRTAVLRADARLPAWRASGGRLLVTGWAGSAQGVSLLTGGRVLGHAVSGRLGRFALSARMPLAPGRYPLRVESDGGVRVLGTVRVRPVVLMAGGDFTPGEQIPALGAAAWASVGPAMARADVATVNLEGVVSDRGVPVPDKAYHLRGPRAVLADAVRLAGLDVVTVANNHSLDFGAAAFADTLATARALGLRTVGGGATSAAAHLPATIDAGGLRIAFLGYSDIVPAGFAASATGPGIATADPDAIAADVRRAARTADIVVCWLHWGIERETRPTARQQQLAADCLGAGAKVVLGAHPHVLQPVVRPSARSVVAWSLGNFVFPPSGPGTERTGLLELELAADGVRAVHLHSATIVGGEPRLS